MNYNYWNNDFPKIDDMNLTFQNINNLDLLYYQTNDTVLSRHN